MRAGIWIRAAHPAARWLVGGLMVVAMTWFAVARGGGATDEVPVPASDEREVAILSGGCFWGMEHLLRDLEGVTDTEVGYAGGHTPDATYTMVSDGTSGHAESVRVVYDPARLSYEDLLRFFFRIHDPTTSNRQGNDIGSQYRSTIQVVDEEQRRTAERVRAEIDASGFWKRPVVTEIADAGTFIPAEDHHQDYLVRKPGGYTCHWIRPEQ